MKDYNIKGVDVDVSTGGMLLSNGVEVFIADPLLLLREEAAEEWDNVVDMFSMAFAASSTLFSCLDLSLLPPESLIPPEMDIPGYSKSMMNISTVHTNPLALKKSPEGILHCYILQEEEE